MNTARYRLAGGPALLGPVLEKARDKSHLVRKTIVNKLRKRQTVWVKPGDSGVTEKLGSGNFSDVYKRADGKIVKAASARNVSLERANRELTREHQVTSANRDNRLFAETELHEKDGKVFLVREPLRPMQDQHATKKLDALTEREFSLVREELDRALKNGYVPNDKLQLGRAANGDVKIMDAGGFERGESSSANQDELADYLNGLRKLFDLPAGLQHVPNSFLQETYENRKFAEESFGAELLEHDERAEAVLKEAESRGVVLQKARDRSHLVRKVITDSIGRRQVKWVKPGDKIKTADQKGPGPIKERTLSKKIDESEISGNVSKLTDEVRSSWEKHGLPRGVWLHGSSDSDLNELSYGKSDTGDIYLTNEFDVADNYAGGERGSVYATRVSGNLADFSKPDEKLIDLLVRRSREVKWLSNLEDEHDDESDFREAVISALKETNYHESPQSDADLANVLGEYGDYEGLIDGKGSTAVIWNEDALNKPDLSEMQKAAASGPGSRGGNVTGYDKKGNPIYGKPGDKKKGKKPEEEKKGRPAGKEKPTGKRTDAAKPAPGARGPGKQDPRTKFLATMRGHVGKFVKNLVSAATEMAGAGLRGVGAEETTEAVRRTGEEAMRVEKKTEQPDERRQTTGKKPRLKKAAPGLVRKRIINVRGKPQTVLVRPGEPEKTEKVRTGAIGVDEEQLHSVSADLVSASPANRHGVIPEVRSSAAEVTITDRKGNEHDVTVSLVPVARDVPRVQLTGTSGEIRTAISADGKITDRVTVFVSRGSWTKKNLESAVRQVLAHELAHGMDPSKKTGVHGDYRSYINHPTEVTASIQQITRELTSPISVSYLESAPDAKPADLLDISQRWNDTRGHYTPENKKRVMRVAARIFEGLKSGKIEPIQKARVVGVGYLRKACKPPLVPVMRKVAGRAGKRPHWQTYCMKGPHDGPGAELKKKSDKKPLDVTKSTEFKKWFGNSKVKSDSGDPAETHPIRVFHGTGARFVEFNKSALGSSMPDVMSGTGFHFTENREVAESFNKNVLSLYLRVENPLIAPEWKVTRDALVHARETAIFSDPEKAAEIDYRVSMYDGVDDNTDHHLAREAHLNQQDTRVFKPASLKIKLTDADLIKIGEHYSNYLQASGYDGIKYLNLVENPDERREDWVAFEPNQIKSVDNQGTFDPSSADIFKAETTALTKACKPPLVEVQRRVVRKGGRRHWQTYCMRDPHAEPERPAGKAAPSEAGAGEGISVGGLNIADYSEKAILITGDTRGALDYLRALKEQLGIGAYNRKLGGWVFPSRLQDDILGYLQSKLGVDASRSEDLDRQEKLAGDRERAVIWKNRLRRGARAESNGKSGKIMSSRLEGDVLIYKIKAESGEIFESSDVRALPAEPKKAAKVINKASESNRGSSEQAVAGGPEKGASEADRQERETSEFVPVQGEPITLHTIDRQNVETATPLDYTAMPADQIVLADKNTILEKPRPGYIPEMTTEFFNRSAGRVMAVKLGPDRYALMTSERVPEGWKKLNRETGKLEPVPGSPPELAVVSLGVLAATQDYYTKLWTAEMIAERDRRKEEYGNWLMEKHGYTRERADRAVKKRISGKRLKKLKNQRVVVGGEVMLRYEFMRPHARLVRNIYPDDFKTDRDAGSHILEINRDLDIKIVDLTVQREFDSLAYKKGVETSYGNVGVVNDLVDSHGVTVKRQDGKKPDAGHLEDVRKAMSEIFAVFGDRSSMNKRTGLRISHSGDRLQFASRSPGLYMPSLNTIGVSAKYGEGPFNLIAAHEFAHYMDKQTGSARSHHYDSDRPGSVANLIASAFRRGMKAAHDSDYVNRTCECFARALEQHFLIKTGTSSGAEFERGHRKNMYMDDAEHQKIIAPLIEIWMSENEELLKALLKAEQTWSGYPLHRRTRFRGLDISIENDVGSVRSGTDADGQEWRTVMRCPYGYIRRTLGADGDKLDCFLGPNENAENVTIIQIKEPGTETPDEDKAMLGFDSEEEAIREWARHYDVPDKYFQNARTIPFEEFKDRHVVPRRFRMRADKMMKARDVSKLVRKVITDSRGRRRTVYVRPGDPAKKKTSAAPAEQKKFEHHENRVVLWNGGPIIHGRLISRLKSFGYDDKLIGTLLKNNMEEIDQKRARELTSSMLARLRANPGEFDSAIAHDVRKTAEKLGLEKADDKFMAGTLGGRYIIMRKAACKPPLVPVQRQVVRKGGRRHWQQYCIKDPHAEKKKEAPVKRQEQVVAEPTATDDDYREYRRLQEVLQAAYVNQLDSDMGWDYDPLKDRATDEDGKPVDRKDLIRELSYISADLPTRDKNAPKKFRALHEKLSGPMLPGMPRRDLKIARKAPEKPAEKKARREPPPKLKPFTYRGYEIAVSDDGYTYKVMADGKSRMAHASEAVVKMWVDSEIESKKAEKRDVNPEKDSLGFTANIMRVGSKVKWTTEVLASQFRTKSTRAMPEGLVATPMDYPLEGTITAINPRTPIITVDWGADNPYHGRTSKVLATNMAVDGSLQAALSTGQRRAKPDGPIWELNDPILDRGDGNPVKARDASPVVPAAPEPTGKLRAVPEEMKQDKPKLPEDVMKEESYRGATIRTYRDGSVVVGGGGMPTKRHFGKDAEWAKKGVDYYMDALETDRAMREKERATMQRIEKERSERMSAYKSRGDKRRKEQAAVLADIEKDIKQTGGYQKMVEKTNNTRHDVEIKTGDLKTEKTFGGWSQFQHNLFFTPDVISDGSMAIMTDAANKSQLKKWKGQFADEKSVPRKNDRGVYTSNDETREYLSRFMSLIRPRSYHEPVKKIEKMEDGLRIKATSDSGDVHLGARRYNAIHALTKFDNVVIDTNENKGAAAVAIFLKQGRPVAALIPLRR